MDHDRKSTNSWNMWIYYAENLTVVLLNPSSGQGRKRNKKDAGETGVLHMKKDRDLWSEYRIHPWAHERRLLNCAYVSFSKKN